MRIRLSIPSTGRARRSATAVAAIGVAALTLASCSNGGSDDQGSSGETVTIEHAQGSTEVPLDPQKVVVMDQSVLQTMVDLDLPDAAAVPALTQWPASLDRYRSDETPKVGTLHEPDAEAINAVEPDLIIIASRSAGAYEQLSEIAPTIDLTVDSKDFLASAQRQNHNLAAVFGEEQRADDRFAQIQERYDTVRGLAEQADRRGLVTMVNGAKITAFGPGSRFGIIHDLGIKPVSDTFAQDVAHGDAISMEFIADQNPDVMFVQDREAGLGDTSGPNASKTLANPLVDGTTAAKDDKIMYMDLYTWYMAPSAPTSIEDQIGLVEQSVR